MSAPAKNQLAAKLMRMPEVEREPRCRNQRLSNRTEATRNAMVNKDLGFTMPEFLMVVLIIGILVALALPSATTAIQNYHVHSDASGIAGYLNVTRMRAASQDTPYSLDLDSTVTPAIYTIERLSSSAYNPLNPSAGTYASFAPPIYEMGTQYTSTGTSFSICRPSAITAYPGPVKADPASCSGPYQFCFNTRGFPVLCTTVGSNPPGSPLLNGGTAIYLTNQNGLADAVTIAVGGVVQVWNWSPNTAQWYQR